jgi:hypothetical protein
MRRAWIRYGWVALLVGVGVACLDPFSAPKREAGVQFLVVDGAYRPNDTTEIQLSRTVNLGATELPPREQGALVEIENENGQRARLNEVSPGRYVLPPGQVVGARVKLRIATANRALYESAFADVLTTPPIESVSHAFSATDGLDYLLSTRAPSEVTLYLRWEFLETWTYTAAFESVLRFVDGRIEPRLERNFLCWQTRASNNILIGSTIGVRDGVIANKKVLNIPARDEKVRIRHSVLVRQQAITREAYDYWEQLAKNSQNLGSLFDPIPSELPGNIVCLSNPEEPVLGYFSAAAVAEKRAFFDAFTEPNRPLVDLPFQNCRLDTVRDLSTFNAGIYEIVTVLPFQFGSGYTYTLDFCVDCRSRGGTTTKPPFWE